MNKVAIIDADLVVVHIVAFIAMWQGGAIKSLSLKRKVSKSLLRQIKSITSQNARR